MKTKNTFLFTFYYAIKKYFYIPIMIFASLMAGHAMNLSEAYYQFILGMQEKAFNSGVSYESLIKDARYVFAFVPPDGWSSNADQMLAFLIIAIVASALLGVFLFKFVTSKKTVNVYYSLGIKRTELFTARYLAGAVMILFAVTLPVLITALVNITWFGSSAVLWKAAFFYIFHYTVVCLTGFTIAAAVSGCIGTMVESIGFTAVLLAFPTVAATCLKNICTALLHGMPTNYIGFNLVEDPVKHIGISLSDTILGKFLEKVNIFTLNKDGFFKVGQVLEKGELKKWAFPSLAPYLLWIVLILAIFFLGVLMFKKRKAEICGFTGRNKVLNSVASALISFFLISIISVKLENVFLLALLGVVISFVIFSIIELILTRSIKDYVKSLKIAPVHAALVILLISTLATGFFGYSNKIPDVKDIESVRISMPISLTGSIQFENYSRYDDFTLRLHRDDPNSFNYYYLETIPYYFLPEIKDEKDIKAVLDVHKNIIKDGKLSAESLEERKNYDKRTNNIKVAIIYKLKDGREIKRIFERVSNSTILGLLKLEDSNCWNNFIDKSLKNRELEDTIPVLFSKQMEKKTFTDRRLNADLLNALTQDIKELSFENFWMSDEEYLGTIELHKNAYFSTAEVSDPKLEAQLEAEEAAIPAEELIRRRWKNDSKFEYFNLHYDPEAVIIPVTANMKNTVKFLKDNNLYDELFDDSPVVSARYVKALDATSTIEKRYEHSVPVFTEFWEKGDAEPFSSDVAASEYSAGSFMPKSAKTVTDKNVIASLLNNAYGLHLDVDGKSAYIVEFTRENGEKTIMYVPSDRVTLN